MTTYLVRKHDAYQSYIHVVNNRAPARYQGIQEWTKKTCGRKPLKKLKLYGLPRLSSTIFSWSILKYLDPKSTTLSPFLNARRRLGILHQKFPVKTAYLIFKSLRYYCYVYTKSQTK